MQFWSKSQMVNSELKNWELLWKILKILYGQQCWIVSLVWAERSDWFRWFFHQKSRKKLGFGTQKGKNCRKPKFKCHKMIAISIFKLQHQEDINIDWWVHFLFRIVINVWQYFFSEFLCESWNIDDCLNFPLLKDEFDET